MGQREDGRFPGVLIVGDRKVGLPYSKGLMANTIMAAGLSPARAYHIAQTVEDRLHGAARASISAEELTRMAVEVIREEAGDRYAQAYEKWQTVGNLDVPLIVLIGGGTGVGKSTIATQLAARLGIVRIISTDAIREVLKSIFSPAMLPTLHVSSFAADEALAGRVGRAEDAVLIGFREQVAAVSVGVRALIERALAEGTDVIIEGAHIVPGFVVPEVGDRGVVVQMVVGVEDEDLHRSHFSLRAHETRARPQERYLPHFANIRRIQKYVRSLALQHGVPVIANYDLDAAIAQVIDLVVSTAVEAAGDRPRRSLGAVRGGTR